MNTRLITMGEVVSRIPFTRTHIYKLVRADKFPRPRKLGSKTVFDAAEIDAYIEDLPTELCDTAQLREGRKKGQRARREKSA